ncbi:hypothetical protein AAG570_004527, partial [Ranatra chinensis]
FFLLQEHLIYCSLQDPGSETPEGYSFKSSVSVWTHAGRLQLDAKKYMEIMESFKPDIYEIFCDGDTNLESSKKRCSKSVDHTEDFLDECLRCHNKSKVLQSNAALFGVIEGGYLIRERLRSAELTAKQKDPAISGFTIDGLHNNGRTPLDGKMDFEKAMEIVKETLKVLPDDKPRTVHGAWTPQQLLRLAESGVDIFDSSLAYILTEAFSAMTFRWDIDTGLDVDQSKSGHDYFISLKDERFAEDFSPITDSCSCLTCRKHTRAYIHHLINAKELLSSTLLML